MSAADPYKYFRIEAAEIVHDLAQGLLDLEKQGTSPPRLAKLLRLAHTLKGAARIVKHRVLAQHAHELEGLLAPLREPGATPTRADTDALLAVVDRITAEVAGLSPAPAAASPAPASAQLAPSGPPLLPRSERNDLGAVLDGLAEIQIQLGHLRDVRELAQLGLRVDHLEREVRRVREETEQLQLVPAGSLFTALERTIRDATPAGTQIDLVGRGGEIRIEGQVLAVLQPALVQLVRNAVAHGLEPAAVRLPAGKPARGTITIDVTQRGGRVTVQVADDGRGIDVRAVDRALARRGGSEASADRSEAWILEQLLRGGITTAATVTELAGRGVGLDVVRDAVRQLGGELAARTSAGVGTTIEITVPVSLSTMSALVVSAGDRIAALPLAAVDRVRQLEEDQLIRTADRHVIALGDTPIAYALLGPILGGARHAAKTVVVVTGADGAVAVGVDQVLGVKDIVHRARPPRVPLDRVVSGLALDQDGLPRPVLDPRALAEAVHARRSDALVEPARTLPILVIDDSLTTRMLEQTILESAGYSVELASSAEEGLAKAQHGRYAMCLVDVEMPGMDGFAFITRLRADAKLAALPAILVTSRNAPDDLARGAAVGAQGYIVKGEFDQTELLAMIAKLVAT